MKTPIVDFVKGYKDLGVSRLHMPGHKGKNYIGCEELDITEIKGADVLYSSEGIIKESEENTSSLFGSAHTFFSTEGSSLCIKAMMSLVAKEDGYILAARNAHKSFVYAAALLDVEVEWLYPKVFTNLCSCLVLPSDIKSFFESASKLPFAVYLTSPDYLGNILDISGIAAVCDEYGVPLLVDNAHGAYLAFANSNTHPIALGATLCCDSAHKTLPVLTGGAYLHISDKAPREFFERAPSKLALFASTSPSYLVLQSLDMCNKYLCESYPDDLLTCIERVKNLKDKLLECGFDVRDTEPLKLVIDTRSFGYLGYDVSDVLSENKVELEYCDSDCIVAMFAPDNVEQDYLRVFDVLSHLPRKDALTVENIFFSKPKKIMSLRRAVFSDSEVVDVVSSCGRICASPTVSCPPAVPVVVSGEEIGEEQIELFKKCGINKVEVVK